MYPPITKCRICKGDKLVDVIDLGEQVITSRFPKLGDFSTPKTKIVLCMCKECSLLQLRYTTESSEMYENENGYGYRSGLNNTMRTHLKNYNEEIRNLVELKEGDVVVDIGSNDATMLKFYPDTLKRIGVDPTGKQFKEFYENVDLVPNYFTFENYNRDYPNQKCKIVSSISMFYDLPDPVQFAKDIYMILEDDGIWTCEQSYLLTMLKRNSIDTICHEHLEYYALHQIKEIAERSGFKILNVLFNDCNGGSFRVYFCKKGCNKYEVNQSLIDSILEVESSFGINDLSTYTSFMDSCNKEVEKLNLLIDTINKNNKNIMIYGASTKGNCLLQYANIDSSKIKYAVERNLNKVGKMTSTGIEIISEETMRKNPPNYLLVLPWHFRDEIVSRESAFLENGGQLIFPFPNLEIYSLKKKRIITGCDGHIAHYVKEKMANTCALYGITKTIQESSEDILKFECNVKNRDLLQKIIEIVYPESIIHLAGISSSDLAQQYPVETLEINGMSTAYICDIIHKLKLKTKLFNASSSEIYKGHVVYNVKEDDTNYFHHHPYAIAKIMGHSLVDMYRKNYGHCFSNGVIFMTESRRRKGNFIMSKIANHAPNWKTSHEVLPLGCLDSFRNCIHASDVANAISCILEQEKGDTYLICNKVRVNVKDLVMGLYSKFGINMYREGDYYYETSSKLPVIQVGDSMRGVQTDINGECTKLYEIGWNIQFSIDDILEDIKGGFST